MRAARVSWTACICAVAASAATFAAGAGATPAVGDAATSVASDVARAANERFWSALHGADYGAYPQALAAVEAALAAAPEDPLQNAHLGWLHMWHLAEAGSFGTTPREMSADLTSAGEYFKRAVTLEPNEARYLGFYATTLVVQSALVSDPIGSRRAEAVLDRAVRMWPEFNLFTGGYIHSSDPEDSPQYSSALRRMWRNLDVCVGRRVSRVHPDFAQYLPLETTVGPKRVCWNSSIAPHNVEGFFLNFGDMLVKEGDVALARAMYVNARLSKTYTEWRYRDVLERRITDAEADVAVFRDSTHSTESDAQVMLRSNFACMACHRQ